MLNRAHLISKTTLGYPWASIRGKGRHCTSYCFFGPRIFQEALVAPSATGLVLGELCRACQLNTQSQRLDLTAYGCPHLSMPPTCLLACRLQAHDPLSLGRGLLRRPTGDALVISGWRPNHLRQIKLCTSFVKLVTLGGTAWSALPWASTATCQLGNWYELARLPTTEYWSTKKKLIREGEARLQMGLVG